MVSFLIGLLKIAGGFTLLIAIHELGHAVAAMLCGVKVKRFSIGMGPGLVIKNVPKLNEVILSPLFFGGYVMLDDEALEKKPLWQKIFVYISGMLANTLLCIVLLALAGMNILKAIYFAFYVWICGIPLLVSALVQGKVAASDAVGGPIGIGSMMVSDQFPYLFVLALVSISLAAFNLIPLPPLDGGRIFVDIIAKLIGAERAKKVNLVLSVVGIVLLLTLLVFATYNDLFKIF